MEYSKENESLEKIQTNFFDKESYRYISTHLNHPVYEIDMIPKSLYDLSISSMLDIGCGNGSFMAKWKKKLNIEFAKGVEPSKDGVKLLNEKWADSKSITFESSFAHKLPFKSDSFELVTNWSVLHWIGRNEYLQSIGEMIRVCSKYLCVMDFVGSKDYRNSYHHQEGLFTYKQDFDKVISASGIMKPIETLTWWVDPKDGKIKKIPENEFLDFENKISYSSRKCVVYEKDFSYLPNKKESDFK